MPANRVAVIGETTASDVEAVMFCIKTLDPMQQRTLKGFIDYARAAKSLDLTSEQGLLDKFARFITACKKLPDQASGKGRKNFPASFRGQDFDAADPSPRTPAARAAPEDEDIVSRKIRAIRTRYPSSAPSPEDSQDEALVPLPDDADINMTDDGTEAGPSCSKDKGKHKALPRRHDLTGANQILAASMVSFSEGLGNAIQALKTTRECVDTFDRARQKYHQAMMAALGEDDKEGDHYKDEDDDEDDANMVDDEEFE